MTHKLNYKEKLGWHLLIDTPLPKCPKCKNDVQAPFFFCSDTGVPYCPDCEMREDQPACFRFDKQHIHHYVIHVEPLVQQDAQK